jgi:AsmA protein
LLKALNLSGTAEGNVQLQLTATSNGDTLHHIAANLNGQLGLASVNDMLDASLLDRALGPVEKAAGLPPPATTPATIRCFGLRLDAAQGVATLRTLGIDSSPLLLRGSGSLSFAQETYNVTLQPANGTQILLAGSFSQPTLTPSPPSPQSSTPQQHPDICHAALTLARLGQPGPAAPPPATATTTSPVPASPNAPKNLLNALLSP